MFPSIYLILNILTFKLLLFFKIIYNLYIKNNSLIELCIISLHVNKICTNIQKKSLK